MAPKLYMTKVSPPVRAVLMCAEAINLKLDLIEVDLLKGDQFKPEFVKINPLHTIPTLDDNGFVLCDSHAIMGYLIGKYAKDKSLYPQDTEKRALIDERLYFDTSVLFARHVRISMPIINGQNKTIPEDLADAVREAYGYLDTFLKDRSYAAGNSLSIADLSVINTVTNASILVPLDESKYLNIISWRRRLENLPYYEINQTGASLYRTLIQNLLTK